MVCTCSRLGRCGVSIFRGSHPLQVLPSIMRSLVEFQSPNPHERVQLHSTKQPGGECIIHIRSQLFPRVCGVANVWPIGKFTPDRFRSFVRPILIPPSMSRLKPCEVCHFWGHLLKLRRSGRWSLSTCQSHGLCTHVTLTGPGRQ